MQPGDLVQCVRTPVDPIFGPLEATGLTRGALYVVVRLHVVENDPDPGLVVRSCAGGRELPGEILVEGLSGKTHVGRCYHASLFRPFFEKPPADARWDDRDVEADAAQEIADRFSRRCFGTVKGSRAKPATAYVRFYDTTLPARRGSISPMPDGKGFSLDYLGGTSWDGPPNPKWMRDFPGLRPWDTRRYRK